MCNKVVPAQPLMFAPLACIPSAFYISIAPGLLSAAPQVAPFPPLPAHSYSSASCGVKGPGCTSSEPERTMLRYITATARNSSKECISVLTGHEFASSSLQTNSYVQPRAEVCTAWNTCSNCTTASLQYSIRCQRLSPLPSSRPDCSLDNASCTSSQTSVARGQKRSHNSGSDSGSSGFNTQCCTDGRGFLAKRGRVSYASSSSCSHTPCSEVSSSASFPNFAHLWHSRPNGHEQAQYSTPPFCEDQPVRNFGQGGLSVQYDNACCSASLVGKTRVIVTTSAPSLQHSSRSHPLRANCHQTQPDLHVPPVTTAKAPCLVFNPLRSRELKYPTFGMSTSTMQLPAVSHVSLVSDALEYSLCCKRIESARFLLQLAKSMSLKEVTTVQFSLHIWKRFTNCATSATKRCNWEQKGYPEHSLLSVCLWIAAKLEEERVLVPRASQIGEPYGLSAADVVDIELDLMQSLNWQPYHNFEVQSAPRLF